MRACARLRDLSVLAIWILGLVGLAPRANAEDPFVFNRPRPKLESLFAHAQRHVIAPKQAVTTTDPVCDIFANGYDATGAKPCATCFDGTKDWDESDIDCGGAWCKTCAEDQRCNSNSDCSSSGCYGGVCVHSVCNGVGCTYCSPSDPQPVCGVNSHCTPQPDTNSVCTSGAGTGASGDACATDTDCAGPLACIFTGIINTCQNWCVYPSLTCPGSQTCTELNPPAYTGSTEWGVCI
jgi:hypothetical protein